jgi:ring-1,2-phenylacetyl-CoA epoxidase subunit PaaA
MSDAPIAEVASAAEAQVRGPEYVAALGKVIASHVRNEAAGATAFDEPAIAWAPTFRDKWLTCRIAMEEFGHHLHFGRLAADLGLEVGGDGVLSVFDHHLTGWNEFVVLKAIVDLAEVVLMEDLARCSYLPLRRLAVRLMPEERFHVAFGQNRTRDLVKDPATRPGVQDAVDAMVRLSLPFFGRSVSANNEAFRRFGIKGLTNDEARAIFIHRTRAFVVDDLGLTYPDVEISWAG